MNRIITTNLSFDLINANTITQYNIYVFRFSCSSVYTICIVHILCFACVFCFVLSFIVRICTKLYACTENTQRTACIQSMKMNVSSFAGWREPSEKTKKNRMRWKWKWKWRETREGRQKNDKTHTQRARTPHARSRTQSTMLNVNL